MFCVLQELFHYELPEKKWDNRKRTYTTKQIKSYNTGLCIFIHLRRVTQANWKTKPVHLFCLPPSAGGFLQSSQVDNHRDFFIAPRKLILSVEGPDPALHAAINKMWHSHTQPYRPLCSALSACSSSSCFRDHSSSTIETETHFHSLQLVKNSILHLVEMLHIIMIIKSWCTSQS